MYSTKDMLKTFIVSMVLGGIITICTALISSITALVLSIPGLKMSRKIKSEIPEYVKESTKGLRRVSTAKKEFDGKTSAPIAQVRADRVAYLMENGLTEPLALASVLQTSRLMWHSVEWDKYISDLKGLLKHVESSTLEIHVAVTKNDITLESCRVLRMAMYGGIDDINDLKFILDKFFSLEDLEKVFGLVDLHKVDVSDAIHKVALEMT